MLRRGDRGRILLKGQDRLTYLHGLLTNDIAALGPGSGCYAALLTPQGRMISDMRVFELGDAVLIDLDATLAPAIREHLDRFVITEDVLVEDATASLAQIGLYGPTAGRTLAAALGRHAVPGESAPDAAALDALRPFENRRWDFSGVPVYVLRSREDGVPGFDLVVAADRADALLDAVHAAGAVFVDPAALEVTRVEAGIPKFLVDMDTTTIPLEAGIEHRAISMTKGCYVGQEVIVRVLHRGGGRVARKLVMLQADGPVDRGDALLAGDREVGSITSAVDSPRFGSRLALGYVHRDVADGGAELSVRSAGGIVRARVARGEIRA